MTVTMISLKLQPRKWKFPIPASNWYSKFHSILQLCKGLTNQPPVRVSAVNEVCTVLEITNFLWCKQIVTHLFSCSKLLKSAHTLSHPTLLLVPKLIGREAPGNPSWLQATSEFVESQRSSHTVPHCPKRNTSSRPDVKELLVVNPWDNLRSPLAVNWLHMWIDLMSVTLTNYICYILPWSTPCSVLLCVTISIIYKCIKHLLLYLKE